jgi:hypothetical protein
MPPHGFDFGTLAKNFLSRIADTLDFAAALAVVCFYTGKEDDPAYEQRFFEL